MKPRIIRIKTDMSFVRQIGVEGGGENIGTGRDGFDSRFFSLKAGASPCDDRLRSGRLNVMGKAGLEPALQRNWILNPARLPIPPLARSSF